MPKPNPPTQVTHPKMVDDNVVSMRPPGKAPVPLDAGPPPEESGSRTARVESGDSTRDPMATDFGPSDSSAHEISERWASAILSLMHVERSRFQDHPIDIPRVHITSLEAIGRPASSLPSGSAHSFITLRKPRSAQIDSAQEASKIHPFQTLSKPKS